MALTKRDAEGFKHGSAAPHQGQSQHSRPLRHIGRIKTRRTDDPDEDDRGASAAGALVLASCSGVSGAVMGLIFGGHIFVAAAVLVSIAIGVAIGIWAGSLIR